MWSVFRQWLEDESGLATIEYALLLAVVALACMGAFMTLGGSMGGTFRTSAQHLSQGPSS